MPRAHRRRGRLILTLDIDLEAGNQAQNSGNMAILGIYCVVIRYRDFYIYLI